MCLEAGKEFVLSLPRITPRIPEVDAEAVMVHSPGQAMKYADRGHMALIQPVQLAHYTRTDMHRSPSNYPARTSI